MTAYEAVLLESRPDLVVVVGDVNSTMAATLTAAKLGIKVAHLEAGLRSFDRTMPEEINRMVTDILADILWTPSADADENLMREGISPEKIDRVGNIMIDALEMLREKIQKLSVYKRFGLKRSNYGVVTLHRPSNVDKSAVLKTLCSSLTSISRRIPLIFPIHPRTKKNIEQESLNTSLDEVPDLHLLDPLNYIRFMNLVFNSRFVITDSGGIQEETTYLGIPCLTVRPNTERPITIHQGTNVLCKPTSLEQNVDKIISGGVMKSGIPELWDGNTANRVARSIRNNFLR
jgi:UDP-N-acetylglucosamine 2-epimerase (non-hydrolysing)